MTSKLTTALFAAAALLVPAATSYAAGTSAPPSATERPSGVVADAAITAKVKAKLAAERDVSAMNIKVDTDGGMVTLSGNARSQAEADKAAELAKTTSGVTFVTNDIKVNATGTTGGKY